MRLTIRTRLTLVYGGLFSAAGVLLLVVTYLLVSRRLQGGEARFSSVGEPGDALPATTPSPPPAEVVANAAAAPPPTVSKTFAGQVVGDTLETLLIQGGIALLLVIAIAVSLGWLIAGRMLQPLQRVTETARRIADAPAADRGLHERIALAGPHDEVRALADTFDLMLERLDHAFDGQRRFIANASHELRTPLTLNRALLEVAVHRRGATPEVRHLGDTLLEINTRHERLIDGLLILARSSAPEALGHRSYVDLADIVTHVAGQLPGTPLQLTAKEAATSGNAVLLERLVHNLVENGLRYNVPGGWVAITCDTDPDGTARLTVSNTGPVVPRYEIPHLFEPFRRLGTERLATSGAGLGLSIVAAIARAHGGAATAEPRDGGGLTVTVTFPPPA